MKTIVPLLLVLNCIGFYSLAQVARPYSLIYSADIKGDFQITGNTVEAAYTINANDTTYNSAMNGSATSNDNLNMRWINNDPAQGFNTFNGSAATLNLPSGAVVSFARLYWGGRVGLTEYNFSQTANRQVRLKKDNGTYYSVTAEGIDSLLTGTQADTAFTYQMYSDVTSLLISTGANGVFTVGNIPCSQGTIGGGGAFGGWSIVVVYTNPSDTYKGIRIYDGYQYIYNGGGTSLSTDTTILSGFNTASSGITAHMGVTGWEGDAAITGDYLKINNTAFSDALNSANNSWNGSSSYFGAPRSGRYPTFSNNLSIDVDDIDASDYLVPGSSTASIIFGTKGDAYYPCYFAFSVNIKQPLLTLSKTVQDANNDHLAQPLEQLTYTISGANLADSGSSYSSYITDTLPSFVTYVPQSMVLTYNGSATSLTDNADADNGKFDALNDALTVNIGADANGTTGGEMKPGDTYKLTFKVQVKDTTGGKKIPIITNTARVTGVSASNVIYSTDSTATILPDTAVKSMPVTLLYFNAHAINTSSNSINWATAAEFNNKNFQVERSIDGIHFTTIATVPGALRSASQLKYGITDNIKDINASAYYYRLKQTDYDGAVVYSRINIIREDISVATTFSVNPNPVASSVNVSLQLEKNEDVTFKITNVSGQVMFTKIVNGIQGSNVFSLPVQSILSPGTYVLQATTADKTFTQKILKL